MTRTQRNFLSLVALAAPAILIACSSSNSTSSTGSGGSSSTTSGHGGTTTASTAASTTSSNSSSGTGTGGGDGGMSCDEQCISMYPNAFPKFEAYQLKECGCSGSMTASPCMGMCTATDCMATMMSQVSQACTTCLTNEAAKGFGSSCTVKAATVDCAGDTTCKPFSSCGVCCATQMKPC